MKIDNKFEIGQIVYRVTDKEQLPGMVMGFHITQNQIMYLVSDMNTTDKYYDFELSAEENKIIML